MKSGGIGKMPNKLKDIFSDDTFIFNGKLKFQDKESYQNFISALEIVQAEGRVVPIEGVTSISTEIRTQGGNYPIDESTNISKLVIAPSMQITELEIEDGAQKKVVPLSYYPTSDKFIIETLPNTVISLKFTFTKGTPQHTIQYKVNFEQADTIEQIASSFSVAKGILKKLYNKSKESLVGKELEEMESITNLINYFSYSSGFFKRLMGVQEKIGLQITPKMIENLTNEMQHDIEELYILLCEEKVLRLSKKLKYTEATSINVEQSDEKILVGKEISLTFSGTIEYNLFDQTYTLYSANMLVNAIVKDIQETDAGTKIFYGDVDSNPMYISYRAFKTEDEASQELETILERQESYAKALTYEEYIKNY